MERSETNKERGESAGQPEPASPQGALSKQKLFWDLQVGVFVEPDNAFDDLLRDLQRMRCRVRHGWPIPDQIPGHFDLVMCSLVADLPSRIPWLPGESSSALIVLDSGVGELNLKLIQNCGAHGILQHPSSSRSLQTSVALALDQFRYETRLRERIGKLEENLRSIRTVEKAKSILIRKRNVSEDEAYAYLRHQSMERRLPIGQIAQSIVDACEFLT